MEWQVYNRDFNSDKFYKMNIFHHCRFEKDAMKHLNNCKNKKEFSGKIASELRYYFWSKCEYEVVITKKNNRIIMTSWVGNKDTELDVTDDKDFDWLNFYEKMEQKYTKHRDSIKIDVYEQVNYKFQDFVDYCWEHTKHA